MELSALVNSGAITNFIDVETSTETKVAYSHSRKPNDSQVDLYQSYEVDQTDELIVLYYKVTLTESYKSKCTSLAIPFTAK